ncbi:MAG: DEAD/DEAH box helicase [Lachnospiraceae bacterium]|nr:DEAD/DEAH box helicase [Lachnospiraceae bacterium]
MAGNYSAKDARNLIFQFDQLRHSLDNSIQAEKAAALDVKAACDNILNAKMLTILQGVSVDELARSKKGLRIKALKDAGIAYMDQLATMSAQRIAAVDGIGPESAREINAEVHRVAAQAKREVRVSLSLDEQNALTDKLVKSIYKYKKIRADVSQALQKTDPYKANIEACTNALDAVGGGLKKLFASSKSKEQAARAYDYLSRLYSGYAAVVNDLDAHVRVYERTDSGTAWANFAAEPVSFVSVIEEVYPGIYGEDETQYGLPEELAEEVRGEDISSEGLKCTLRRYQEWGVKYILHQGNVLLGDEMGLGKTIQAIAAMVSLRSCGATHSFVVCPASVLANWCREIVKMSDLKAYKVHGPSRDAEFEAWVKKGGVAVTTYETCGSLKVDANLHYDLLVVDEAHYIKNPAAQRTNNVIRLSTKAERILFMTGTPLENNVDEMIALINILQPKVADNARNISSISSAPQFMKTVAPVYYRRKREDVLNELPEKEEIDEWCTMTKEDMIVYAACVLGRNYAQSRRVSWNVKDLKDSSKAQRLLEIVKEAEEDGRKVLVFSFFLDTIDRVVKLLGDKAMGPVTGAVPPGRRQEIIDEFEQAPAGTVLVGQVQSLGTGLNIQSASVVIICEPQFKPSTENQAISRAYRMGQSRKVLVYRLLCEGSVDERIMEILENKQQIFDDYADESVAAQRAEGITDSGYRDLIEEEIDRIKKSDEYKDIVIHV